MEQETNHLIAERVPPGDNWKITTLQTTKVYGSLTDTLEAYFQTTGEKCHFRLEPLNGKLFAIKTEEVEEVIEAPKRYNMYGDGELT